MPMVEQAVVADDTNNVLQLGMGACAEMAERNQFDTNMEILPGKRSKGGQAEEAPAEKPMSKRKKRKLEQLEKKHASKALRSQVLSELRDVQLTTEQAQLMRASQSTRISRREKVAMAKRRIASGLDLPDDMKYLRRRAPAAHANEQEDQDVTDGEEERDETLSTPGKTPMQPMLAPQIHCAIESSDRNKVPSQPAEKSDQAIAEQSNASQQNSAADKSVVEQPSITVLPQLLSPVRVQRTSLIEEQRSKLPAVMCEQEVVETVLSNDVTLVSGDTGCGKSTQIPQFLYESGICNGSRYLIGVTQPRRVAAISVSQRVAQELNDTQTVGYQVRYDRSHCSSDTRIKFMTDGILLRELQADFLCRKYTAIVIDEAHERGVNCDILIGLLSRAVQRRRKNYEEAVAAGRYKATKNSDEDGDSLPPPPLRLVIMSATLRVCDFTENQQLFPRPPPVVKIDARTFPVTVHFARRTEDDYIKAAHRSVLQINKQLPPGTVLVFVTGKQEVRRLCGLLRRSNAQSRRSVGDAEAGKVDADVEDAGEGGGDVEYLEGSDDEDCAFDDELSKPDKNLSELTTNLAPGTGTEASLVNNDDALARNGGKEVLDSPTDSSVRKPKCRKGKKRKCAKSNEQIADSQEVTMMADGCGTATSQTKKRRTKKKGSKTAGEARLEGQHDKTLLDGKPDAGDALHATENATTQKTDMDECDVNYRIDAEEDVVVLEAESLAAEDAKDFEAKRQKRQKMVKLDKSRTAGGVFCGAGFGEGPIRVYPLYAQLPAREQLAAFVNPKEGERCVIVATNVAETSITLPNVRYVVDTGQEKRRKYRASSGVSSFVIDRISKASADQRAGRAGRLGPGHSYRLYSAAAYENHMTQFAPIAVLHVPMDPVLLLIASLGVPFLDLFPWPTPPPSDAITAATLRLQALGALAASDLAKGQRALQCTQLGFRLATLPVSPRYAKMLLSAVESCADGAMNVIPHACALVAALSVGNLVSLDAAGSLGPDIDDEPGEGESELVRAQREAQKRFREAQGKEPPRWTQLRDDAEGLLWLMGGYAWAISTGERQAERFCQENRANARQMSEAHSLMQQLGSLLRRKVSLETVGIKLELPLKPRPPNAAQAERLRACLVDGLVDHVAVARPDLGRNAYVCADLGAGTVVFIHCSSNAYRHRPHPSLLVFNEIISSSRHFMRDCVSMDPLLLSKRAASNDCQLLQLGEFLAVPAPRYLPDKDSVLAFASPSYTPLGHMLPTIEVDVPADSIFRYKVFAKALLEGEVLDSLPASGLSLLARPAVVLHSPNNPRVMGIVGPLWEQRIGSRASLLQRWSEDRRFLLEGYLRWLPSAMHDDVRMTWPPMSSGKKRR